MIKKLHKRIFIKILFVLVLLLTVIINIPSNALSKFITYYSKEKLMLANTSGSLWHGSGLLVALDKKVSQSSPLLMLNWDILFGIKDFITINFTIDNNKIAQIILNKNGINLNQLNLSLSVSQVSQLFGLIHDLNLAGNLHIQTQNNIQINKLGYVGNILINLTNLSSSLSPVNPLGSYLINLDLSNYAINVSSEQNSTLMVNGDGDLSSLELRANIMETKKLQMKEFIAFMGIPLPDGSYNFKIF